MEVYGYVRCSSAEQNEARQMIAMRELNVHDDRIFIDKQSGKDFDRPAYQLLEIHLKFRYTLFVKYLKVKSHTGVCKNNANRKKSEQIVKFQKLPLASQVKSIIKTATF